MADNKEQELPQEAAAIVAKAKGFWAKFSKPIIYIGSAIILLAGSWFIYKNYFKLPKEKKAEELIFPAEKLFDVMSSNTGFNKDSISLVLNGGIINNANATGLLKIIKNYDGTDAGNRAQFMAGACYLNLGDYDKAIKYLKAFDGNGANQVASKAYLLLGHAYAGKNKTDDALSYYKKAASVLNDKDEAQKAYPLFIAGRYADKIGKTKEAKEIFEQLKADFPNAAQVTSKEVDKYLAKYGIVSE